MISTRLLGGALFLALATAVFAADFKLVDGTVVTGEPSSYSRDGLVVRQPDGKFSPRTPWYKFSQEALQQLAKDPKALVFVQPLIPPKVEDVAAPKRAQIAIVEPPKAELPPPGTGLGAALATPMGLALFLILLLANLYAAYEVAVFRNYPPPIVIGAAVPLPVLAQIVFLCLKTKAFKAAPLPEAMQEPDPDPVAEEARRNLPRPGIPDDDEQPSEGLKLTAQSDEEAVEIPLDHVELWSRSDQMLNRRFFENNFRGFFRVALGPRERQLVLVIKSARGEFIGQRVSRISNNELHLQLRSGGASSEVMIPFNDITEVSVRHKDAV
jgi:hypothetical protein